jgi:hypothetical protein
MRLSFIVQGTEDICKSSKSISPSSTKSLYCFSTDSNSGANNLTFSKKEVFQNKYIYLNEGNDETTRCLNLFFSDQTVLAYVEPFKEKYHTFFDLLDNEQVNFNNFNKKFVLL